MAAVVTIGTVVAATAPAGADASSRTTARSKPTGEITVFAASSLTEAFTQIGEDFSSKYKNTKVTFNFGSSSTLEAQLEQAAPGDVFASADTTNLGKLDAAGGVSGASIVFVRNRLEIAVEPGNPKNIKTLADTLKNDVLLILCAPEIPCGKYALLAYENVDLEVPTVPTGLTAKDTLAKVIFGEADAAVVYVTDINAASPDVDGVKIAKVDNVIGEYAIAVVKATTNPPTAKLFVKYVTSKAGQATLKRHGFLAP